jgi:hypothetical protein
LASRHAATFRSLRTQGTNRKWHLSYQF